jgi:hypothetical protein
VLENLYTCLRVAASAKAGGTFKRETTHFLTKSKTLLQVKSRIAHKGCQITAW